MPKAKRETHMNASKRITGQRTQMRLQWIDVAPKTMLLAVLTIAGCWIGIQLLPVLLVVVVAIFLVGTLNPAVKWLQRRGIGRGTGIAAVFLALLVITTLLGMLTIPALVDQARALTNTNRAINASPFRVTFSEFSRRRGAAQWRHAFP